MAATRDSQKTFTLNNGVAIPGIGFGTWKAKPDDAYESVKTALQNGYRHIDTAFVSITLDRWLSLFLMTSHFKIFKLRLIFPPFRTMATKATSAEPSETAVCPERTYS